MIFSAYFIVVIHFGRSQVEDEEPTTIPLSTMTDVVLEQSIKRVSLNASSRTLIALRRNESEQNINFINLNESSKQRLVVALAVLCAAFVVLLTFLVSIVVCQWFHYDKNLRNLPNETSNLRTNFSTFSYNCPYHTYQQSIKF